MRKVTNDEFYNKIGERDVVLNVVGNYPYKTEFKLRHDGKLLGVIQDHDIAGLVASEYFLKDDEGMGKNEN